MQKWRHARELCKATSAHLCVHVKAAFYNLQVTVVAKIKHGCCSTKSESCPTSHAKAINEEGSSCTPHLIIFRFI